MERSRVKQITGVNYMNMNKIKSILGNKKLYILLFLVSFAGNLFLLSVLDKPQLPISKRLIIGNYAPTDTNGTLYLAHGVIAFRNKSDQPKNALQIVTFYADKETGKFYQDQNILIGDSMTSLGREEMELVSYDKNTNMITLSGAGWSKVIINAPEKKVIEATDTTGDVVYLKSTWEINN